MRWHLRDSLRAETRGKTERSPIRDHKVVWTYESLWTTHLVIDKGSMLSDSFLEFQIFQEMYGGKERHALGKLILNLAEYAQELDGLTRRYLLHDSKVNSTLKLHIELEQISGDHDYSVPDLKKAQVFGGLTGLIADGRQNRSRDQEGNMTLGTQSASNQENIGVELEQDVYRNSLTRRWQAQAGEQDPADVIEDIFRGSDGWLEVESTKTNGAHDASSNQPKVLPMTSRRNNCERENTTNQEYARARAENEEIIASITWNVQDPDTK